VNAHQHHWWQHEHFLVHAMTLLVFATLATLLAVAVIGFVRPELRRLEMGL
jgi:hypothetical protein